jgi:hypothetical protein
MARELNYLITYIHISKLSVVWSKAQRPYQEKWAKQIGEEFDPDKFEPVIVTKPNGAGIYHIVEGQHRVGGAKQALGEDQQLPCHVVDHADPARAAEIWLGINKGRKAVRPVIAFIVAIEAKREPEVAINNIVRKCGYHIGENTAVDNVIASIAVLKKVYAKFGDKILTYTLEGCRLLWGSDPKGSSGTMIGGLALFLNEFHEQVDEKRLRRVLQEKYKSPFKLVQAAHMAKERASEPLDVSLAELIRMQYNKGLSLTEKKLKRKEI